MTYQFRRASEADAAVLAAINASASEHPWSLQMFHDSIVSHECWIVESEHKPVAGMVCSVVLDEVELLNVFVHPEQQGQGVGRQLMLFLQDNNNRPNGKIFLEVRESNAAAIALYEKSGFTVVNRRRSYYPLRQGREDALIMIYEYV